MDEVVTARSLIRRVTLTAHDADLASDLLIHIRQPGLCISLRPISGFSGPHCFDPLSTAPKEHPQVSCYGANRWPRGHSQAL